MRTVNVIEGIFFAAVEKQTPVERNAYLDEACTGDPELRRCVERMLEAQPKIGDFLQRASPSTPATTEEPAIEEHPGTIIGPYKLLQQLGEGGFGVVFMAEQEQPVRRKVAFKIIKPGMDSKQVVARFEAERQALAMMDHPNIARVLDGGTTERGRPYFVMEMVKGIPITEFCDKNRLTPRERLELFIPVCQAVQHAHQKGIIHRDIKPSNVLVTQYDDKPVPKVIDFGVAKAIEQKLTEQTLFTRVGQIIGTIEYMSPEQASPGALDVDTRSDIYSLGVLLYELLTGTTPLNKDRLQGVAFLEMLRLIREEEPPRPSTRLSESGNALSAVAVYRKTETQKLPKLVKGELDWIAMKALEKNRSRRYDTANALAADVHRYLKDEQVEACPPSLTYRLQKYVRKHKVAFATTSMAAALLLFGIVGTSWGWIEALSQRDDAERARKGEADQVAIAVAAFTDAKEAGDKARRLAGKETDARKLADEERHKALVEKLRADLERQKAVDNENTAEWRLYAAHVASAQREWESDNVPLLHHYLNLSRPEFRGWEHDYLYTLPNRYQQILPAAGKSWSHIAFSPDDKRLAVGSGGSDFIKGRKGAMDVQVLDLASGKVILSLRNTWGPVAFSPDGTRLACSWDHGDGGDPANGFRFKTEGMAKVWDAVTGKEIFSLPGHTHRIRSVVFSPDGKRLATASLDEDVKLWDMESGTEIKLPVGVGRMFFSPDGRQIAISTREGAVVVWDMASGKPLMTFENLRDQLWEIALSPDGKRLAATFVTNDHVRNGYVKVWELTTGQEVFAFKARTGPLFFTPDGKCFFSASAERVNALARTDTVKVWELAGGQEVLTLRGPSGPVALSHDGKRLASIGSDGVRIWLFRF